MVKKKTHEEFVKEVYDLVGDEYTVLSNYINNNTHVEFLHNKCNNIIKIKPYNFISSGTRCKHCKIANKRKGIDKFIQEVNEKFEEGNFDILSSDYISNKSSIKIRHNNTYCNNHEWETTPTVFLNSKYGCPICAYNGVSMTNSLNTKIFKDRVKNIVGNEYKVLGEYINNSTKIEMQHEKCGKTFQITPQHFLDRQNCVFCSNELKRKSQDEFVKEVLELTGSEYTVLGEYIGTCKKILIRHNNKSCNNYEYMVKPNDFLSNNNRCPKCAASQSTSRAELEITEFIKQYYKGEVVTSDRTILSGSEIDIYLPELKLGIEYNGYYWHCDKFKEKNYHLNKLQKAHEAGINLLFIDEIDWLNKQDICKSRILYNLNAVNNRLYARKTEIFIPTVAQEREFLNINHIQGYIASSLKIGLKFDNKMVAILTFAKSRKNVNQSGNNDSLELLRYATDISLTVVGGFSKLLKYSKEIIKENYPDVNKIKTFSDNNLSYGNLYEKNGFILDHVSKPSYFYIYQNVKVNRFSFRKSELKRRFPEYYQEGLTEFQIADSIPNLFRVWNTGNNVYYYDI